MMGYKRQKRIGAVLGVILGIGLVVLFELVPGTRQAVGAFFAQPPYILAGVLVGVLIIFLPRYRRSAQLSTEADRLLSQGHVVAALEGGFGAQLRG